MRAVGKSGGPGLGSGSLGAFINQLSPGVMQPRVNAIHNALARALGGNAAPVGGGAEHPNSLSGIAGAYAQQQAAAQDPYYGTVRNPQTIAAQYAQQAPDITPHGVPRGGPSAQFNRPQGPPSGVRGSAIPGRPFTQHAKVPSIVGPSHSTPASNMPFRGIPNNNASNMPQGRTSNNNASNMRFGANNQVHPVVSAIAQQRNQLAAQPPVARVAQSVAQPQQQQPSGGTPVDPNAAAIYGRAANAVDLQLTPQEQALQRQALLDNANFQYSGAQDAANTQRTVQEQQMLYSKLGQQLTGQLPQIGGNYDAGIDQTKAIYGDLQNSLGQQYGNAISSTNGEVNRLGLQPAGPQATQQMTSDESFLKGLAGSDSAVNQSTMLSDKSNALRDALSNIATQAGNGASLSGGTLRDAQRIQNQNQVDQGTKIADLLGQAATLEGSRPGLVSENVNKIQDLQSQAQAAAQQQAFDNQISSMKAQAQYNLSGAEGTLKSAQADAARMDAMTKQQVANATIGKTNAEQQAILDKMTPGTVAYRQVESQISKNQADSAASLANASTNRTNANTNAYKATHPAAGVLKGIAGSVQYLQSALGAGASSTAMSQVANHAVNKYPPSGTKANNDANFAKALGEARRVAEAQGSDQTMLNALDAAVGIAYGH